MKKLHLLVIIVVIIPLILFGFFIYQENVSFKKELENYNLQVQATKAEQEELNREFQNSQRQKQQEIKSINTQLMNKDEDGDGLTYSEELKLGTNDNEKDTDGDGIEDNIDRHPAGGGKIYKKTVVWMHNGLQYTTQFGIEEDKYWYYKDQERGYCCLGWEKFATPNDLTIKTIAADITDVSLTTGESCKACIAIDFVESMIYQYDIDYNGRNEYPKYAIETIVDERGDCEDTSFLMASILEALGIDVILLDLPGHMAVGVWCEDCSGTYYLYNNKKYFYLETTGEAGYWKIGSIPPTYMFTIPEIIDI